MTLSQATESHLAAGSSLWGTMFIWVSDLGLRGKDEELVTFSAKAPFPILLRRGLLGASLIYSLLRGTSASDGIVRSTLHSR